MITMKAHDTLWAHVSCIQLIPGVVFTDEHKQSIRYRDNLTMNNNERPCQFCNKNTGMMIKVEFLYIIVYA